MNLAALLIAPLMLSGQAHVATRNPRVLIQTALGAIEVEIDGNRAPVTATNFLRYVDAGHYKGGRFHRTVTMQNQPDKNIKIEVIQGGVNPSFEKKDFEPIKLERTSETHLLHLDGTISMARDGADTATSDFFICIGNQPELNYGGKRNPDGHGFAAFGHVTKGMDVVRMIQRSHAKAQTLEPAIKILSIERVK
ncbi:MAG: peptidyl-prolyl cis-trans isomerase [Fimbriimonadaceae bacterium]|jgi:peptidyl-prolyl cis-trans isomerase A (cyclophilin A)|nr:peptidyl-prolyl cis-trans isomerase [Fimbriimonadaceae bacterium]